MHYKDLAKLFYLVNIILPLQNYSLTVFFNKLLFSAWLKIQAEYLNLMCQFIKLLKLHNVHQKYLQ